jgi:hypothetical protein
MVSVEDDVIDTADSCTFIDGGGPCDPSLSHPTRLYVGLAVGYMFDITAETTDVATATNPKVTRVVPDDGPGFIIGMVLHLLIPALFFLSCGFAPRGRRTTGGARADRSGRRSARRSRARSLIIRPGRAETCCSHAGEIVSKDCARKDRTDLRAAVLDAFSRSGSASS